MDRAHASRLAKFYADHLFDVILPFWLKRGIDRDNGGYLTCFDNTGRNLASTDKYVWSQGRFAYVLAATCGLTCGDQPYLSLAAAGIDFLQEHCFLDNGHCAFLLGRDGAPKEPAPGAGLEASTYADCFVAAGFARYAAAAEDAAALEVGLELYDSICRRIEAGAFRTEPYPLPAGYRAHGVAMIALNTGQELAEAMENLGHGRVDKVRRRCSAFAAEVMNTFAAGDAVLETLGPNGAPPDNVLGRYVNPGHTMESMWFLMHHARRTGDKAVIVRAGELVKNAFRLGWDEEYGGLLQYVDKDGGKPSGSAADLEDCPMVDKLADDWDNKLWWVHSEALYACLLAGVLTGDPELLRMHEKLHEYTFGTFPNPDSDIGEWIQIRDRRGRPVEKTTCLPVKDPMHIWRDLILLIRLLEADGSAGVRR